ncbi:MAG: nitrite/sulfite reductase [Gammaproteobacteria bacterium]|nr:nitrite/sulfite reductase [Gammaproteobacteria bacterium]
MYQYDQYDQQIVNERVAQFRDQTQRYLAGKLSEDEYRPLRLMNGLYIQRHAPMLRVSIPYGLLSSTQLRMLAHIAEQYDKGYGHFSTRQNIQFNWPRLETVPDILGHLANVQMHAIQTSGNCIRNITSDHFAGIAEDELEDPRPYCEIIRQWSTFHPEFSFLPRKFKIAISGSQNDRAAVQIHDIGIYLVRNATGEIGCRILVGGGLGRTPYLGVCIREYLEKKHLLSYLEAILRVYNQLGRRDNMHKARVKILLNAVGAETFTTMVETEWEHLKDSALLLDQAEIDRVSAFFTAPEFDPNAAEDATFAKRLVLQKDFNLWVQRNVKAHKAPGYRAVCVSLKHPDMAPGDATHTQMNYIAELADRFSHAEIRVTHDQNLALPHVRQSDLYPLWNALQKERLATPNIGLLTDMICCPGLDFCNLANAGSIDVASQINARFTELDYLHDIGDFQIKMSGCMNACGHHHVGHIGILGVDKKGEEFYQLTLGGSAGNNARLGDRLGPAIAKQDVAETIDSILQVYLEQREGDEQFLDTYLRVGLKPFKQRVYNPAAQPPTELAAVAGY